MADEEPIEEPKPGKSWEEEAWETFDKLFDKFPKFPPFPDFPPVDRTPPTFHTFTSNRTEPYQQVGTCIDVNGHNFQAFAGAPGTIVVVCTRCGKVR